jgi:hypothetical protein
METKINVSVREGVYLGRRRCRGRNQPIVIFALLQTTECLLGRSFFAGADPFQTARYRGTHGFEGAGDVDQVYLKFLDNPEHKRTFLKDYNFPPIFCVADTLLQNMLENFCVI